MYPFYQESELINPVSEYFKDKGYKVRYEIRIGFCRADIVAFKDEKTTAVELKLRDWKKAIVQAKNYQLGTNYVYIAIPLSRVYNFLRKAEHYIKNEGIGLLIINEKTLKVNKYINAKHSKKQIGNISFDAVNKKMFKPSKYKFL
ncbi:MAG: hypothetical protein AYK22_03495 [Thermoplasmatales archaeon SG8-52-3]|nr:MAG: hypothetical protein AYK22_03495 [Thermoplasmatales archaeon SG8-52-3]